MLNHKTILIVEDTPADAEFFLAVLRKVYPHARCITTESVAEATEYLEGRGRFSDRKEFPVPTIAFVDLKLTDGHGSEIIKWLRKQPLYAKLLVVVLTGATDIRHLSALYGWGADSFILKTSSESEMLRSLRELNEYWIQRGLLEPLPAKPAPF